MVKSTTEELNRRFRYHPPGHEAKVLHERVNDATLHLALLLNEMVPEGRSLELALEALEEVRWRSLRAVSLGLAAGAPVPEVTGPPEGDGAGEVTSPEVARLAGQELRKGKAARARRVAASALSQTRNRGKAKGKKRR